MSVDQSSRRQVEGESAADLVACPFCASTNLGLYEHVYAKHFAVKCNLCGGEGPQRSDPEEAARLWNRRVQV